MYLFQQQHVSLLFEHPLEQLFPPPQQHTSSIRMMIHQMQEQLFPLLKHISSLTSLVFDCSILCAPPRNVA